MESDLCAMTAGTCDKDKLEPLLREQAERFGAYIRFRRKMLSFEQHDEYVRVRVGNHHTSREEEASRSISLVQTVPTAWVR